MNNLYTVTSSSLKSLVSHLAKEIKLNSAGPLVPETVVVQSSGMSRWINIEIARLNGVCAGINYKFPNTLIDEIFSKIVPEAAGASPFEPDILSWRIMSTLPNLLEYAEFEPVKNYCNGTVDDRGLLQFSTKVADCFDQYTIYRPEMILEWDRGGGKGWQPLLWRAVSEGCYSRHRAAYLNIFRERISKGINAENVLPEKIRLFGVSYLPLYHLEILSLLSSCSEVVIYLLNPCGEFWGDLISRKKLASIVLHENQNLEAEEYYETGNPLLSSLGTMGQEFFNLLLDFGAACETLDDSPPVSETSKSLLYNLQSDILHMHDRSKVQTSDNKIDLTDNSIQIHSCHGPLREMQVLYDNLLQMFKDLPDLEPRHILVMTPDIESYAPYISAVFGARAHDRQEIPFTIADRSQQFENTEIKTFIMLLKLSGSRFGVNQILELLESEAIMSRFNFSTDEIEAVREWLSATNVRWGKDACHRKSLGFTEYEENSWQTAINRLLLGYALPSDGSRLFNDIFPFGEIEGSKTLIIGKLVYFFEQAKQSASLLEKHRTLSDWAETLTTIVKNMMGISDHSSNNLKPVYEAIQKLRENQDQSGFSAEICLDAVKMTLISHLDKPGASYGFMGGKVTFCAMLPMRSIPFRIICMIGMNDSIFPRNSRHPGFSLMKGKRLCGDRSLREEDRYLFLEALMSAEERLFISYTGQSCRDNSEIPPSVVVSELLDYINSCFSSAGQNKTTNKIVFKHHLQSFSPAYFKSDAYGPFFSYSRSDCQALEARRTSGYVELPFCSHPLPIQDSDVFKVDIRNLIRFFKNPAAYFLAFRLGVRLDKLESMVEERESFSFNSLDNYLLKQDAVRFIIEGGDGNELYLSTKAASKLPPLSSGLFAFQAAITEAEIFANKVRPHLSGTLEPVSVSIQLGKFYISGHLTEISSEHLLRFHSANLKAKDRLSIWIEHLILNLISPPGYPRTSLLVCKDAIFTLPPMDNASEILTDLLDIYINGLCSPLLFFPETSFKMKLKGLADAEKCWNGDGFGWAIAEKIDPAYQLCFGRQNPLNEEFSALAMKIYGPLLDVAKEEPL